MCGKRHLTCMIYTIVREKKLSEQCLDNYLSNHCVSFLAQEIAENQDLSLALLKKHNNKLYYSENISKQIRKEQEKEAFLFHTHSGKKIKAIVSHSDNYYERSSLFFALQELFSEDFWQKQYQTLDVIDFILYPKMKKTLFNLLSSYKVKRREILIQSSFSCLRELLILWHKLPSSSLPKKPKSFKEIYQKLLLAMRTEGIANYAFEKQYISEFGPYLIKTPKDYYELVSWGVQLNNCAASFSYSHHRGDCCVLGVFKKGRLLYLVEMQGKKIIQFVNSSQKHFHHPELEWWLSYGTDDISI